MNALIQILVLAIVMTSCGASESGKGGLLGGLSNSGSGGVCLAGCNTQMNAQVSFGEAIDVTPDGCIGRAARVFDDGTGLTAFMVLKCTEGWQLYRVGLTYAGSQLSIGRMGPVCGAGSDLTGVERMDAVSGTGNFGVGWACRENSSTWSYQFSSVTSDGALPTPAVLGVESGKWASDVVPNIRVSYEPESAQFAFVRPGKFHRLSLAGEIQGGAVSLAIGGRSLIESVQPMSGGWMVIQSDASWDGNEINCHSVSTLGSLKCSDVTLATSSRGASGAKRLLGSTGLVSHSPENSPALTFYSMSSSICSASGTAELGRSLPSKVGSLLGATVVDVRYSGVLWGTTTGTVELGMIDRTSIGIEAVSPVVDFRTLFDAHILVRGQEIDVVVARDNSIELVRGTRGQSK